MKKIVLDTNIWIQYFNDTNTSVHELLDLIRKCSEHLSLYYHEATEEDLKKDQYQERRNYQLKLTQIAGCIKKIRIPSAKISAIEKKNDNDRIDLEILDSLLCGKYDFLVTEDKGLKRNAGYLDLASKVFSCNEFIQYCIKEYRIFQPQYFIPKIECLKGEQINHLLPFFDSLRADYVGFDVWFSSKCAKRDCYVVLDNNEIAGIAILNQEEETKLKICTFKISEDFRGLKYGEALLRSVFEYAVGRKYTSIFLTAFEDKQEYLIKHFLLPFGFSIEKDAEGSTVYLKDKLTLVNTTEVTLINNFRMSDYPVVSSDFPEVVLIPIQPLWHNKLFPEYVPPERQLLLLQPSAEVCGYALSKTYVCKAQTISISQGSLALFYLSNTKKSITSSAIIQEYIVAESFEHLCTLTKNKTVYKIEELRELWGDGSNSVKVIVFRLLCHFEPVIPWEQAPPQSLTNISKHTEFVADVLKHPKIKPWLK